jgi:ATP-dependent Clp protease ATP-binding subunit ClpB
MPSGRLNRPKLGAVAELKQQLNKEQNELVSAQCRSDFERAGQLIYGRIPEQAKRPVAAEAQDRRASMVEDTVMPEHLAHVVSR